MNQKILLFIFYVFLVALSFAMAYRIFDPDFGWHLKTGQLILERGVPYTDWYSYTMPDFPWINHEWLTDIFIYTTYNYFGFYSLLLIFLCLYTASFFILKNRTDNLTFFICIVVLGYFTSLSFIGIRPQLLTVLFIEVEKYENH